ncbi:hypothetical protein JKP88DRAFT_244268 [Tribonema minus]|uniref:Crinkler (CRN) family protein n=1 Tax=Tribonema minus TaxID=303371 RepID=A0A835Z8X3_9STRA|nr:hypothetical protein JKP88DRAFT_244268 [Tribonema minus]
MNEANKPSASMLETTEQQDKRMLEALWKVAAQKLDATQLTLVKQAGPVLLRHELLAATIIVHSTDKTLESFFEVVAEILRRYIEKCAKRDQQFHAAEAKFMEGSLMSLRMPSVAAAPTCAAVMCNIQSVQTRHYRAWERRTRAFNFKLLPVRELLMARVARNIIGPRNQVGTWAFKFGHVTPDLIRHHRRLQAGKVASQRLAGMGLREPLPNSALPKNTMWRTTGLRGPIMLRATRATARSRTRYAFKARMCRSQKTDLDEPQVLQMPADVTVPAFQASGTAGLSGILIRECWPAFRDCILRDKCANVVSGTPGVGKSWFAWWFMACLLRGTEGRAPLPFVVYQRRANQSFLLGRDGRVFRGSAGAFAGQLTHLGSDAWLILDGLQPEDIIRHHVLVICASRPSAYKVLYPLAEYPTMTEERLQKLYGWYRGVPRCVLTIPSREACLEMDEHAFNGVVAQARRKPSKVLTMVASGYIPEPYHKVLYNEPIDERFELVRLIFACRKVTELLLENVKKAGEQALTQVFDDLQKYPGQAALCGQVFEVLMINALAAGCDVPVSSSTIATHLNSERVSCDEHTSVRANDLALKGGRRVHVQYTISTFEEDLKDCWQREGVWGGRTLLVPDGANFPEVDAILLPARPAGVASTGSGQACVDEIELCQFTVSRNNRVLHRTQLGRVLAALPAARQYTLYYIVPAAEHGTFRLKSITRETVVGEAQCRLDRVKLRVISPSRPFQDWAL